MTYRHIIFGLFVITLLLASIITAIIAIWPDTGCLINGIDFNGNNDPFGLFCF